MTLHIVRDEDNTKNFLDDIPPVLLPMITKFAVSCTDIYLSDHLGDDFAAVETEIVAASWEAGRDALRAVVENRDDGAKSIYRDGKSWYRIPPTKGSFKCQFGVVEYKRPRYRHRGESKSLCPVDEGLGLIDGGLTRPFAKATTRLMAECTPRTVTSILAQICNMGPSVSTLQRSTASVHKHFEEIEDDVLSEVRRQETIPEEAVSVSGSLDGVMVNLRKGEYPVGTEDDSGTSGSNWREASCATITFYDKDGNKLKTISSGQMPEKNKMKLKRWLVEELELILKKRPDLTFVAVADGAFDNWRFLSAQNPDVEVLDFYHATTHLSQASEYALSPKTWYAKWRDILLHEPDGVDRVISAIRGLCSRASSETAQKELKVKFNYFRTHRHRMNYRDLKQKGLPIGSGIVEAVNKTHVDERMKKSGMRWSIIGGQGILTIRSWVKSDRFDRVWKLVMADLVNKIPANDNCKPNHDLALAA